MYDIKDQCQQIFGPESDACEQNLVRNHILKNVYSFRKDLVNEVLFIFKRMKSARYYGAKLIIGISTILLFNV